MAGDRRARNENPDRRQFLKSAALAGGALALGSIPLGAGRARAVAPPIGGLPVPNPNNAPVDRIVVLMQENRSFDHYFGWRTGLLAAPPSYLDGNGDAQQIYHLAPDYRGCHHPDPDHSWEGGRTQVNDGFLAPTNDEFAIGYYLESDVEFYAKLARQFTLCDDYFCSLLGPTFPNREYMHSAQSGGLKVNSLPSSPEGFPWATIWDLLETAGVPWAYYFVDLPAIGLWGPRLAKGARHIEHFFADAKAGTLPNVVFVDPGFTTGLRTDEHPFGDMRAGQAFVHNVVKAVVEAPFWPSTAMFINFDEWGGFFDRVQTPPRTADVRATDSDPGGQEDFGQLGFRVPCLVLSPYSRRDVLASTLAPPGRFYDHTSILKFIEWRFGLPSLTLRDAAAANIGTELLDFAQTPRLDAAEIVDMLPRPPVTSLPCPGEELEGIPGSPVTGIPHPEGDAFQSALESGYFERAGYRIELKPLRHALGG